MLEPDHVGALALTGEIALRRGNFAEAAEALARLALLADAPDKNRLTAGIAAVDLFENKLDRFDRAPGNPARAPPREALQRSPFESDSLARRRAPARGRRPRKSSKS